VVGTARINYVLYNIDHEVCLDHVDVHIVSDDDEGTLPSSPSLPSTAGAISSQSPHTKVANQHGCEGQVNKSRRKRKWKLLARDESIASTSINFSNRILEVEKLKLQIT